MTHCYPIEQYEVIIIILSVSCFNNVPTLDIERRSYQPKRGFKVPLKWVQIKDREHDRRQGEFRNLNLINRFIYIELHNSWSTSMLSIDKQPDAISRLIINHVASFAALINIRYAHLFDSIFSEPGRINNFSQQK